VVSILQSGGVIIYPTDTIYGMGCKVSSHAAIARIYQLKGRRENKPMSFICAGISQVSQYAVVSDAMYRLAKQLLPGPYTLVLPASPTCPKAIQSAHRAVGIRIPDHAVTQAIVQALGEPLLTTSANASGANPISDPNQLEQQFGKVVDCILDAGLTSNEASTVLDCTGPEVVVLRQGAGQWPIAAA
jgi:tRNA threonylcarbamoyl adenosine modification protein (Sua5/YciO/YrdC/YwlC family)